LLERHVDISCVLYKLVPLTVVAIGTASEGRCCTSSLGCRGRQLDCMVDTPLSNSLNKVLGGGVVLGLQGLCRYRDQTSC
jgi:hypothetical protein